MSVNANPARSSGEIPRYSIFRNVNYMTYTRTRWFTLWDMLGRDRHYGLCSMVIRLKPPLCLSCFHCRNSVSAVRLRASVSTVHTYPVASISGYHTCTHRTRPMIRRPMRLIRLNLPFLSLHVSTVRPRANSMRHSSFWNHCHSVFFSDLRMDENGDYLFPGPFNPGGLTGVKGV